MAAIPQMLGLSGSGPGVAGPQAANIINPVTDEQTKKAYQDQQLALAQQQALVGQLQGQNALANQSSVFNQLQGVASGQGPNPAQAMLSNATGNNVAQQAALMAGQRGGSQNAGMLARNIGQQGAGIQQNAAGQAAALQAQQSLGALGQMGGMANTQAAQLMSGVGANTAANQAQQNALLNTIQGVNQANVGSQNSINNYNAQMSQARAGQQGQLLGALAGAAGTALGGPIGGMIGAGLGNMFSSSASKPQVISGPATPSAPPTTMVAAEGGMVPSGPKSRFGQHLAAMAKGGPVPALVSPGEKYLDPKDVQKVAQTGENPMKVGETIPGKPKVGGAKNSYANDTVPKTLEEGGIVLPRSVTQAKDAPKKAAEFVAAILKQQALKKS